MSATSIRAEIPTEGWKAFHGWSQTAAIVQQPPSAFTLDYANRAGNALQSTHYRTKVRHYITRLINEPDTNPKNALYW